jgi:hypothetical protein
LVLELKTASQPRNADELRQAFLDELGERIDQFDSDQDWDEILLRQARRLNSPGASGGKLGIFCCPGSVQGFPKMSEISDKTKRHLERQMPLSSSCVSILPAAVAPVAEAGC